MATPALKPLDLFVLRSWWFCSVALILTWLSAINVVPCLPEISEPSILILESFPAPVAIIFTLPPALTWDL